MRFIAPFAVALDLAEAATEGRNVTYMATKMVVKTATTTLGVSAGGVACAAVATTVVGAVACPAHREWHGAWLPDRRPTIGTHCRTCGQRGERATATLRFVSVYFAVAAVWVGLMAMATSQAGKIWRGSGAIGAGVPGWWVWGRSLWRAYVRGMPVSIAFGWLIPPTLVLLGLSAGAESSAVGEALAMLFVSGILVFLILVLSIALFNWPSALVPPALRSDRGVASEPSDRGAPPPSSEVTPTPWSVRPHVLQSSAQVSWAARCSGISLGAWRAFSASS